MTGRGFSAEFVWLIRPALARREMLFPDLVVLMNARGHQWHANYLTRLEKGVKRLRLDEAVDVADILGLSLFSFVGLDHVKAEVYDAAA